MPFLILFQFNILRTRCLNTSTIILFSETHFFPTAKYLFYHTFDIK